MGSIRRLENIAKLTKTSPTTLTLGTSVIAVGAFQYSNALTLTLSTTGGTGPGYLDAGTIVINSLYYVYAINNSGNLALIASLNATNPAGYTQSRMLGLFLTDSVGAMYSVLNTDRAIGSYTQRTNDLVNALSFSATPTGWVSARNFCYFYSDSNGNWKFNFNIAGTVTSATSFSISISGLLFKSIANYYQAISVGNGTYTTGGYAQTGSGALFGTVSSAATFLLMSGDVELDALPSTYIVAANMQNINFT